MDIKIAVAYHKPSPLIGCETFVPVHAGAATSNIVIEGIARDDEGDNISALNFTYCELTVIYWLWKNTKADVKGLIHYRRTLGVNNKLTFRLKRIFHRMRRRTVNTLVKCRFPEFESQAIKMAECLPSLLEDYDVVVSKPAIVRYSVKDHFSNICSTYYDLLEASVEKLYPEYMPYYKRMMSGQRLHFSNITVMRTNNFDEYCTFLFNILEDVRHKVEAEDKMPDAKPRKSFNRMLGYLAELVTHVFVDYGMAEKGFRVKELPVYFLND